MLRGFVERMLPTQGRNFLLEYPRQREKRDLLSRPKKKKKGKPHFKTHTHTRAHAHIHTYDYAYTDAHAHTDWK